MWGDLKLGGNQVEYGNEDLIVAQMFQEACVKAGFALLVDALRYRH